MTQQLSDERRRYQAAFLRWKAFLESTPAYVECDVEHLLADVNPSATAFTLGIRWPRLDLFCERCDGVRGFNPSLETTYLERQENVFITYRCRDCGVWVKTFALTIIPNKDTKAVKGLKYGEFPPFGSHLSKRLQDLLSKGDLELYRKGLRSEREGHGIGAAAYFRRVVENQWRNLIAKLRDAAAKLGTDPKELAIFDEATRQQQFSTALGMLKDAIPPKLLILDGQNPLALLYGPLSAQLHDLTDDECLQQAADIRVILNELFDNINRALKDDAELKGAVERLRRPKV